jgi:hypothetical protein
MRGYWSFETFHRVNYQMVESKKMMKSSFYFANRYYRLSLERICNSSKYICTLEIHLHLSCSLFYSTGVTSILGATPIVRVYVPVE